MHGDIHGLYDHARMAPAFRGRLATSTYTLTTYEYSSGTDTQQVTVLYNFRRLLCMCLFKLSLLGALQQCTVQWLYIPGMPKSRLHATGEQESPHLRGLYRHCKGLANLTGTPIRG